MPAQRFLVFLLFLQGCAGKKAERFQRFGDVEVLAMRESGLRAETCRCEMPSSGRVAIRIAFTGRHLVGRAELFPGAATRGACLVAGESIAVQSASWGSLSPCSGFPPGLAAWKLPNLEKGQSLHFDFAFRGEAQDVSRGWAAYVEPLLFLPDCPSVCRLPAARWPTGITLGHLPADVSCDVATKDVASAEARWEEPYPRLAVVFRRPDHVPVRLDAGGRFEGFSRDDPARTLARLHAFDSFVDPPGSPRRVVFDSQIPFPWGVQSWRFVRGQDDDEAWLAEVSARIPIWTHAPLHARAGAVHACVLAQMEPDARVRRQKAFHEAYLNWIVKRAAHGPPLPAPPAYWALLFSGVLQSSPDGLQPADCNRIFASDPVLSFHEVLARFEGRIPRSVLLDPPAPSIRVAGLVWRSGATEVEFYNDSEISLWVPVRYKSSETTRNHWVFIQGKTGRQRVAIQQTGKPVDLLIDPDHVSLALPFGWTRDGPPEDLDGPPNVTPEETLD